MRVEEEDAEVIKKLQEAGCEYGVVSDLLDLVERLQHGDPMNEESRRLWRVAAIAAPMTRTERRERGIDK